MKRVKQIEGYSNTLATIKGTHTIMVLTIDNCVTVFEDLNRAQYPILLHSLECDDTVEAYVVTDDEEVIYFD